MGVLAAQAGVEAGEIASEAARPETWISIFNGYAGVMLAAFFVTLVTTPLMRRLAVANGVVDRPDARKVHRRPIAYLGGVAVWCGIMAGIVLSYFGPELELLIRFHEGAAENPQTLRPFVVPPSVVLGLTVIMLIGLFDDVASISPRLKLAGQLFAAAALALDDVGVRVAGGVLAPTLGALLDNPELTWTIQLPATIFGQDQIPIDLIYWAGTAIIAVFVLGACNASNLIDGLDGLLSGVTGIATVGLLAISLMMIFDPDASGDRDAARVILCLAVLGACLGFLPHNFNPANIFLGDTGSMLLGFVTIVIILMLGDTGRTDLVLAGLIVYAIPIIDTVLAIVRRKLSGKRMSDPDSDHLHHMLKRALGVKGAVFVLYGIGIGFAGLGVLIASSGDRVVYTLTMVAASFLMVYATKIARMKALEEQVASKDRAAAAAAEKPAAPRPAPEAEPASGAGARAT